MRLPALERLFLMLVSVVTFALPTGAVGLQETETVDRTLAFPAGGTLELHNFSGDVHITGTTGQNIVIHATRSAKREQLDHIKLDISSTSSAVVIEANKRDSNWGDHKDNVVDTKFTIEVPAAARLNLDVFSSDVDVKNVTGSQRLKTFSGDIKIDAVSAGASPAISAETFSGEVRARLADGAKSSVVFDSFSGRFESELPITLRSSGRRNVHGSVGSQPTDGELAFRTFSGDVRIVK